MVSSYRMYIDIGSLLTLSRDGKIAVASLVTALVVASILFFIVGFLCGNFYQKRRSRRISGQTQIPYYDDVMLHQPDEQELELKENVAYALVQ